jgi:hypothetical protein
MALDVDGSLLVVETGARQLSRVDLATGAISVVATGLDVGMPGLEGFPPTWWFDGVAVGPSGAIYVSENGRNVLTRIAVRVTETAGRAGDADYLVYLPADWNGDLVLFGHGAFGPMRPAGRFWFPLPLGFGPERAQMPFVINRDVAVCHGFAWAASAMTGSGMTIAEGIRDTHLLLVVARRHLPAEPAATYVTGFGLPGGSVAVALAETYGALPTAVRRRDVFSPRRSRTHCCAWPASITPGASTGTPMASASRSSARTPSLPTRCRRWSRSPRASAWL